METKNPFTKIDNELWVGTTTAGQYLDGTLFDAARDVPVCQHVQQRKIEWTIQVFHALARSIWPFAVRASMGDAWSAWMRDGADPSAMPGRPVVLHEIAVQASTQNARAIAVLDGQQRSFCMHAVTFWAILRQSVEADGLHINTDWYDILFLRPARHDKTTIRRQRMQFAPQPADTDDGDESCSRAPMARLVESLAMSNRSLNDPDRTAREAALHAAQAELDDLLRAVKRSKNRRGGDQAGLLAGIIQHMDGLLDACVANWPDTGRMYWIDIFMQKMLEHTVIVAQVLDADTDAAEFFRTKNSTGMPLSEVSLIRTNLLSVLDGARRNAARDAVDAIERACVDAAPGNPQKARERAADVLRLGLSVATGFPMPKRIGADGEEADISKRGNGAFLAVQYALDQCETPIAAAALAEAIVAASTEMLPRYLFLTCGPSTASLSAWMARGADLARLGSLVAVAKMSGAFTSLICLLERVDADVTAEILAVGLAAKVWSDLESAVIAASARKTVGRPRGPQKYRLDQASSRVLDRMDAAVRKSREAGDGKSWEEVLRTLDLRAMFVAAIRTAGYWPDAAARTAIAAALPTLPMTNDLARVCLCLLEHGQNNGVVLPAADVQVEHFIARAYREKTATEVGFAGPPEAWSETVACLGNLYLLPARANQSIGCAAPSDKVTRLGQSGRVGINRDIMGQGCVTIATMQARSAREADRLFRVLDALVASTDGLRRAA